MKIPSRCWGSVAALTASLLGVWSLRSEPIALSGPTTEWKVVNFSATNQFDYFNDSQAGSADLDIVGSSTHAAIYTQFDDRGTTNTTDDLVGFRVRLAGGDNGGDFSGVMLVGIDANSDGKLDLFLSADGRNNGRAVKIFSPGNGANTSPSTTSISAPANQKVYPFGSSNYSVVAVSSVSDPIPNLNTNLNGDAKGDIFVSFAVSFEDVRTEMQRISSVTITAQSPLRYVVITLTQNNAINGDISGLNGGVNSSVTYTQLGLFSSTTALQDTAPNFSGSFTDQSTSIGVPVGPLSFTVSDAQSPATNLVVTGSSTNTTLVPNSNIAFGGSGSNRTVTVTPAAAQTGVTLIRVVVSDGNLSATNQFTLTVTNSDSVAPAVGSIVRSAPVAAAVNTNTLVFRLSFSEPVTGVDASDFAVTATGTAGAGISGVAAIDGATYDVTLNSVTGNGTVRLDLNNSGTGIADLAGNAIASGYTAGEIFTIDSTAPNAPDLSGITEDTGFSSTDLLTVDTTLLFQGTAEPGSTVLVRAGVISIGTAAVDGTGTWVFDYRSTVLAQGIHPFSIIATDAAGNASEPTFFSVAIDGVAPSAVSIVRHVPTASTVNSNTVVFRMTFNEAVLGLDQNDFTVVTTGTANGAVESVTAVNDQTLDVRLSGLSGEGTVRLDLNGAGTGITDYAGNNINGGFNGGQSYTLDYTAPSAASLGSIDQDTGVSSADFITADTTLVLQGTAEPGSTVTVYLGATVLGTVVVNGAGNWSFDHSSTTLSEGTNLFRISVRDTAGNAGATNSFNVVVDTTAPSVGSITRLVPTSQSVNTNTVVFRVIFSEAITGLDTGDFAVTSTATAVGSVTSLSAVDDRTFDVLIGGLSGDGTLRLDLSASGTGISDIAGNAIASGFAGGESYALDNTVPNAPTVGSISSDTGISSADRITSDNTLVLNGTAEPGTSVSIRLNGVVIGTALVDGSGNWSFDYTGTPLAEGTNTFVISATDDADNVSPETSFDVVIDRTGPAAGSIVRLAPAAPLANTNTVIVRITFNEPVTGVDASDFSVSATGTTSGTITNVSAVGATSYDLVVVSVSGNGTMRVDLNGSDTGIEDLAGNPISGGLANGETYTIDTQAPETPAFTGITDDTGTPGDLLTSDAALLLSGSAEPDSLITVRLSGSIIGSTNASAVGLWTFDYTSTTLPEGTNTFAVSATDAVGNVSLATNFNVIIDSTAPSVGTVLRHAPLNEAVNTNTVVFRILFGEAITGADAADFSVTGTGTAAGVIASVQPIDERTLEIVVGSLTGDGLIRLDVGGNETGIRDLAGNALNSRFTAGQTYILDNTVPAAPSFTAISDDTGSVANDALTSDTTLVLSGSADSNTLVSISLANVVVGVTNADANGLWQFDFTSVVLSEGTNVFGFTSTDAAGNISAVTNVAVVIDITAPQVGSITRVSAPVANTNDIVVRITFSEPVTNVDAADFTVAATGTAAGSVSSVVAVNGSTYDVTVSGLTGDGTLRVDLSAESTGITDLAGNPIAGGFNAGDTIALDNTVPATPLVLAISDDTGASSIDFVTRDTTLLIGGTAEPFSVIELRLGGELTAITNANAGGEWTFDLTQEPLAPGTFSFGVTARDEAGNTSAATNFVVVIDTSVEAPSAPDLVASSDTGSSSSDNVTADNTPSLTGVAETGSTVTLKSGDASIGTAVATNGTWVITSSLLTNGVHVITAVAEDAAGNVSIPSEALNITVVNGTPSISLAGTATIPEDGVLQSLAITLTDGDSDPGLLTLSASSSNESLVPAGNIVFSGAGGARTLSITPATNASGSATITVTVRDESDATATADLVLTVTAENDRPTLGSLSDLYLVKNAGATNVLLLGIGAGAGESQPLNITAFVSDENLITNLAVAYTSPEATGLLTFAVTSNRTGSAVVTIVVNDGFDSISNQFNISVLNPVHIVEHPQSDALCAGNNTELTVAVVGDGPFQYQWRFNGIELPDATNDTLTLPAVEAPQVGIYDVLVSNPAMTLASRPASLSIVSDNQLRIVNILVPKRDKSAVLTLSGPVGQNVEIHGTFDFQQWSTLTNFTFTENCFRFVDPQAAQRFDARYYKLVPKP
jgi:hypothetical protein